MPACQHDWHAHDQQEKLRNAGGRGQILLHLHGGQPGPETQLPSGAHTPWRSHPGLPVHPDGCGGVGQDGVGTVNEVSGMITTTSSLIAPVTERTMMDTQDRSYVWEYSQEDGRAGVGSHARRGKFLAVVGLFLAAASFWLLVSQTQAAWCLQLNVPRLPLYI